MFAPSLSNGSSPSACLSLCFAAYKAANGQYFTSSPASWMTVLICLLIKPTPASAEPFAFESSGTDEVFLILLSAHHSFILFVFNSVPGSECNLSTLYFNFLWMYRMVSLMASSTSPELLLFNGVTKIIIFFRSTGSLGTSSSSLSCNSRDSCNALSSSSSSASSSSSMKISSSSSKPYSDATSRPALSLSPFCLRSSKSSSS